MNYKILHMKVAKEIFGDQGSVLNSPTMNKVTMVNSLTAIGNPEKGDLAFDTSVPGLFLYNGTTWFSVTGGMELREEFIQSRVDTAAMEINASPFGSEPITEVTEQGLSLTPGEWEVSGIIALQSAVVGTNWTTLRGAISSSADPATNPPVGPKVFPDASKIAVPDSMGQMRIDYGVPAGEQPQFATVTLAFPAYRLTLNFNATLFLWVKPSFSAGKVKVWGSFRARRV